MLARILPSRSRFLGRLFCSAKQFTLEYVENGQTALMRINNPVKKNALSKQLLDDVGLW